MTSLPRFFRRKTSAPTLNGVFDPETYALYLPFGDTPNAARIAELDGVFIDAATGHFCTLEWACYWTGNAGDSAEWRVYAYFTDSVPTEAIGRWVYNTRDLSRVNDEIAEIALSAQELMAVIA